MLKLTDLSKGFTRGDNRITLFESLSTDIHKGDRIAIIGPSGQGKSTLLRILAKLDTPDTGKLHWENFSEQADPVKWRMRLSYIAQQPTMLPGTVKENLQTVSILHNKPFHKDRASKLLDAFGLVDLDLDKNSQDLSGGEKQRIALVRSLLMDAPVVLLDEITSSLDWKSKQSIEAFFLRWARDAEKTFLWVTHDLEQAQKMSSRIWFFYDGKLQEDCPSDTFFSQPQTVAGRVFLQTKGVSE